MTIDYYLSLNSPWTYMGSGPFAEIARRYGATVNVKPAKFGPIFEQTGGLPLPKRSPQRRAYRLMELRRWREVRGIPLNVEPKHFPSDDLAANRLVIAAKLQGKDAHRLSLEFGRAIWEREESLADPAVMSYHERAGNNCISIERADLVLAGCAILDAIRDAFPLPRLRVADRGLREGMLVEMMREDGALRVG